jgi:hypothetical protein
VVGVVVNPNHIDLPQLWMPIYYAKPPTLNIPTPVQGNKKCTAILSKSK